jgi:beta-1,2-mannobiose phosphorylase / 1,2-beta-oligomannan phosphorylase
MTPKENNVKPAPPSILLPSPTGRGVGGEGRELRRIFLTPVLALLLVLNTALSAEEFPLALTRFEPGPINPVFTAEGPGHWDVKMRERGWILREGEIYQLWFTGYDGSKEGIKRLGYATSADGIHWTRYPHNPIYGEHWVEDMMVVKQGNMYYMFSEGLDDHAQLLTSPDKIHWKWIGFLDIRMADGRPIEKGPYGTPTAWFENGRWHLFYERGDRAVWLAQSKDLKVFTNVQDEPVLVPGPEEYDRKLIALNQIIKHNGRYYACYHGSPWGAKPVNWSSNLATSTDLIHWKKFPGNPLRPLSENKSSNLLIDDGKQFRLYTMHDSVWAHFPTSARDK